MKRHAGSRWKFVATRQAHGVRLATAAVVLLIGGCREKPGASVPAVPVAAAHHAHHAPHGGTLIELGDEAYHLDLVLDRSNGTLQCYVLDGEAENFVRCGAPSFEMVAKVSGGPERRLTFSAVADIATGEQVGDTSLFTASADWLKESSEFDAVLVSLAIRGTMFENVPLHFSDRR